MRCPFCSYGESKVVDSRPTDDGERIRRRRECLRCQRRFTTYEAIETVPLMVLKKDGSIEGFDRNKRAVDEIELTLQNSLARECPSSQIGEMAMEQLKTIDEAAYVRFASVYRQFKDIGSFMEELKNLLAHSAGESESSEGQGNKKD